MADTNRWDEQKTIVAGYCKQMPSLCLPFEILQLILHYFITTINIWSLPAPYVHAKCVRKAANYALKSYYCSGINADALYYISRNNTLIVEGFNRTNKLGIVGVTTNTQKDFKPLTVQNKFKNAKLAARGWLIFNSIIVTQSCDNDIIYCVGGQYYPAPFAKCGASGKILNLKIRVKDVVGGNQHVLILANNGNVYSYGNNKRGACGTNNNYRENISMPTKINFKRKNMNIIQINCSEHTSYFLNHDGSVYVCGSNYHCNRCNGKQNDNLYGINECDDQIEKIEYFTKRDIKIKMVKTGSQHVGFMDTHNNIYFGGYNLGEKCGIKRNIERDSKFGYFNIGWPTEPDIKFNKVTCFGLGGCRSVVITTQYVVIYGNGYPQNHTFCKQILIEKLRKSIGNKQIIDVVVGWSKIYLITS